MNLVELMEITNCEKKKVERWKLL